MAGVFFLTFQACERSVESACGEFPQVEREIDQQRVAFTSLPDPKGRRPASTGSQTRYKLSEEQRDAWLQWTEGLLKKTQWVRDSFEGDSKRRPALKAMEDAALALVTLHGFVEQGKMKKAVGSLDQLKKSLKTAYERACVAKIEVPKAQSAVRKKTKKDRSPASTVKKEKTGSKKKPASKKAKK